MCIGCDITSAALSLADCFNHIVRNIISAQYCCTNQVRLVRNSPRFSLPHMFCPCLFLFVCWNETRKFILRLLSWERSPFLCLVAIHSPVVNTRARGKRRGFRPGAAARHRSRTRVSTCFFPLFSTYSAVCEGFL